MENKKQNMLLKGFVGFSTIALSLYFYAKQDCPIMSISREKQISMPINHGLDSLHEYYICGLQSTVTSNLDCPVGAY